MITLEHLKLASKLHRIPRFNSYTLTKAKSVLEHSARVAFIYEYLGGTDLLAALSHDLSEAALGFDPPSPIKKLIPGIKEYEEQFQPKFTDQEQKDLCKLADGIELILDLIEQQQLGNHAPQLLDIYNEVLEETMERAKKLGKKAEVKKLMKDLTS